MRDREFIVAILRRTGATYSRRYSQITRNCVNRYSYHVNSLTWKPAVSARCSTLKTNATNPQRASNQNRHVQLQRCFESR